MGLKVIDLGQLASATNGTAIDLESASAQYGQGVFTGRTVLFNMDGSAAVLTAALQYYADGVKDAAGTWSGGTWTDYSGSSVAFVAADAQGRRFAVTLKEPYVRFNCSAYTSGKLRASLTVFDS